MKTYIKHNSNNTRLESRRHSIYSTHETPANKNPCQIHGEIETVRHITNECPAYQYERQILVKELIAHEVDKNIDLYDIVLCSKMLNDQPKTQQVEEPSKLC